MARPILNIGPLWNAGWLDARYRGRQTLGMQLTQDQQRMLARMIENYPDHGNAALNRGTIINAFAVALRWDHQHAGKVYDGLKEAGAVHSIGGIDFITPDGAQAGLKVLQQQQVQGNHDAEHRERRHRRREVGNLLWGGLIGLVSAIIALYVAHVTGWNK